MLNTGGHMIGNLLAGALTVNIAPRSVLIVFMALSAVSAIIIIGGNRRAVSEVYNREL